jgi:RNA 2',3'-cyclic 3'-phosphodiesterase
MTKRIFIATEISGNRSIDIILEEFKNIFAAEHIRWVNSQQMHITLHFFGDTDTDNIPALQETIANACKDALCFDLTIKGAGVFKSIRHPTVLWLGTDQSEQLNSIKQQLDIGLLGMNLQTEQTVFRPHLTLGRVRQMTNVEILKAIITKYHDQVLAKVSIREVILFESILLPKGPEYKKLFIQKLKEPVL